MIEAIENSEMLQLIVGIDVALAFLCLIQGARVGFLALRDYLIEKRYRRDKIKREAERRAKNKERTEKLLEEIDFKNMDTKQKVLVISTLVSVDLMFRSR